MWKNFNLLEFIVIIIPLLVAVIAHEYAHGYAAFRLGDPTAKNAGRLSFNPIRHLDPVGSFLLPLMLKLSGAPFLFGYARPVPVNFANLRPLKAGTLWVASAGVITNFMLALASAGIFHAIIYSQRLWQGMLVQPAMLVLVKLMVYSVMINLVLAIFNLIPILPLDGGRIAATLLPPNARRQFQRIEPFGFFILILLLFTNMLDLIVKFSITPLMNLLLGA